MATLLILLVVLMLGLSASRIAVQDEKAARNDRDRQLALQAAEAALIDAQLDIEGGAMAPALRAQLFAEPSVSEFAAGCNAGRDNPLLGVCAADEAVSRPVWEHIDLTDDSANAVTVPYGRFTGRLLQVGRGSLPARLPRYLIERLVDTASGTVADAGARQYVYRITAVGFGARDTGSVVLQAMYRRAG